MEKIFFPENGLLVVQQVSVKHTISIIFAFNTHLVITAIVVQVTSRADLGYRGALATHIILNPFIVFG